MLHEVVPCGLPHFGGWTPNWSVSLCPFKPKQGVPQLWHTRVSTAKGLARTCQCQWSYLENCYFCFLGLRAFINPQETVARRANLAPCLWTGIRAPSHRMIRFTYLQEYRPCPESWPWQKKPGLEGATWEKLNYVSPLWWIPTRKGGGGFSGRRHSPPL